MWGTIFSTIDMTEECWAARGSLTGLDQHIEKDIKGEHMPPDLPPKQAYSILISFVELFNIVIQWFYTNFNSVLYMISTFSALGLKFSFCSCQKKSFILCYFWPFKVWGAANWKDIVNKKSYLSICMKKQWDK
jgi:hypothetical protein